MTSTEENVVVYVITETNHLHSWGRGTFMEAEKAVRNPPWPARPTDRFIAVDDWGHGNVVASYDENLLGLSWSQVKQAFERKQS